MNDPITVRKLDENGRLVFEYAGIVLARGPQWVQLEAYFAFKDYDAGYHIFKQGDRFVEWFYADRWYNIFEMYDVDDGAHKGWYCNITRPAQITDATVSAQDLALDLMVYPDGRMQVLDRDEFQALALDDETRRCALAGLDALLTLVRQAEGIFAKTRTSKA